MKLENLLHKNLTDVILKSFFEVYNELGYGFLENVYQNALTYELRLKGLVADTQKIIVEYKDIIMGNYYIDKVVNEKIILELKACEGIIYQTSISNNQLSPKHKFWSQATIFEKSIR